MADARSAEREQVTRDRTDRVRKVAAWTLLVLTLVNAASAVAGGVGILLTDGMGMPRSFLVGGPFTSFLLPGLILLVVVGGTQTLAAVFLLARRESSLLWAAGAGFGMVIWIFVETGLIRGSSWLQAAYFATGMFQLITVIGLLGVVAWLPRRPLAETLRRAPSARRA